MKNNITIMTIISCTIATILFLLIIRPIPILIFIGLLWIWGNAYIIIKNRDKFDKGANKMKCEDCYNRKYLDIAGKYYCKISDHGFSRDDLVYIEDLTEEEIENCDDYDSISEAEHDMLHNKMYQECWEYVRCCDYENLKKVYDFIKTFSDFEEIICDMKK